MDLRSYHLRMIKKTARVGSESILERLPPGGFEGTNERCSPALRNANVVWLRREALGMSDEVEQAFAPRRSKPDVSSGMRRP